MNDIPDLAWYWVDLYIVFTFEKWNQAQGDELSDYEIVKHLLEPLEKWVQ